MKSKAKNRGLWVLAVVLTIAFVIYQRATGPTYPHKGSVVIEGQTLDYELLRSYEVGKNATVEINIANKDVRGIFTYKRYKSYDEWTSMEMKRVGDTLKAEIPMQPAAGKVEYKVELKYGGKTINLTDEPVILRYKGVVPKPILVPHIFFMFISMLFGLRAGIEAFFKGDDSKYYVGVTLICLFIGGIILGPIVQKFAFGEYWTGWPYGTDLTDNKTAITLIFWIIAFVMLMRNKMHRIMVIVGAVVMIAVYIIPHSARGSEIDYTKTEAHQTEIAE
jgi:hypothetical protein